MEIEQGQRFTLQMQVAGAWKLVQARSHAQAVDLDCAGSPMSEGKLWWLSMLVGRDVREGDPEHAWTILDAAYVAEFLIVALISGCVPMPRTQPLPIAELHALLDLGTGCLPPYTST